MAIARTTTYRALLASLLSGVLMISAASAANPRSININFGINLDDANAVNSDETSIVGLAGSLASSGSGWNNILLGTAAATPVTFTTATQGGNHIDVIEASGSDSGVDLFSTGAFYSNFGNVSTPNQTTTGDAGLLQSYLLLSNTESLTLTGVATWAPNGYRVRAVFDIGAVTTRTYGITMSGGGSPQTFWTADSATSDSDPDNDGVITWITTSATTEASAIPNANNALFGPFTGNTLTISSVSSSRGVLSGIQIIPLNDPLPTIASFTATPSTFTAGETVSLAWSVSGADTVSISPSVGTVSASGTFNLTPSATTTWTLTATRGGDQTTAQVTATRSLGPIDVYLLSGQSNMQGTAVSSKLPAQLLSIPEIKLYAAGTGVSPTIANKWVTLRPANVSTFGPEIGIGERLRDLCPGQPIALIKYAASGNSLEINFRPGANAADTANWGGSFTSMVNTFNNGLAALEADGWQPVIKGMCWQQGEQDAKDGLNVSESDHSADDYGANLSHFVNRVRAQFASHASPAGIRFVPGQVLPYAPPGGDVVARFPGRGIVRQAILNADENSGAPLSISNSRSIPTNSTTHPVHAQDGGSTDEVHLNATAQLALGRSMAYAMLHLDPLTYLDWASSFSLVGGPEDDDDHDGLTNRTEYMFGGNPADRASAHYPALGSLVLGGLATQTYTLTRNLEASDLAPNIQFSADLADWSSNPPALLSSEKQADGTALLTFRAPSSFSDPTHRRGFFRTVESAP